MKFRSNPFNLSKFIESLNWFSHIHSKEKAHYEKRRPATGLRGLCLIHDNAPAHKCVLVQDFLKAEKVVQLFHPSYSPDLSPCDFFLFFFFFFFFFTKENPFWQCNLPVSVGYEYT